jgi:hypothetical protein
MEPGSIWEAPLAPLYHPCRPPDLPISGVIPRLALPRIAKPDCRPRSMLDPLMDWAVQLLESCGNDSRRVSFFGAPSGYGGWIAF